MIEKIPYIKFENGEILEAGESKQSIKGEISIQKFIYGYDLSSRTSIINHLIKKNNYKKYLEIGVRKGENFKKININNKIAVDPDPLFDHKNLKKVSSDEFFKNNTETFDIIFIDGLHLEKQVDKDISNSLSCISKNGLIIMHDCNPPSEFHQREKYEVNGEYPAWNGTVWKSFAKLRMNNNSLTLYCVNCDWGIGIIKKRSSKLFKFNKKLDYKFLDQNRNELLNLISVREFLDIF